MKSKDKIVVRYTKDQKAFEDGYKQGVFDVREQVKFLLDDDALLIQCNFTNTEVRPLRRYFNERMKLWEKQ